MDPVAETDRTAGTSEAPEADCPIAFLMPSYRTPLLASELLYAAISCGKFAGVKFVLLLDQADPNLPVYKALVASVREKGLDTGYFIFDGAPYAGMVNRVAPLLPVECLCVIDNRHLPMTEKSVSESIRAWLATSPQRMRVGVWNESGDYPVVTRKLVDRLGYMFHPICFGRAEAESWLLTLATNLEAVSDIAGATIAVSPAEGAELIGTSSADDAEWSCKTLEQTLGDEIDRLDEYVMR